MPTPTKSKRNKMRKRCEILLFEMPCVVWAKIRLCSITQLPNTLKKFWQVLTIRSVMKFLVQCLKFEPARKGRFIALWWVACCQRPRKRLPSIKGWIIIFFLIVYICTKESEWAIEQARGVGFLLEYSYYKL